MCLFCGKHQGLAILYFLHDEEFCLMRSLIVKLWKDDAGIVALEYLLVATIVGLGLIVGLAAVEGAINVELTELGNAIMALSQGYSIKGQSNCKAQRDGSQAIDTPGTISFALTPPAIPSVVDVPLCN
jgi:Flp pilus assembly pilin Flp